MLTLIEGEQQCVVHGHYLTWVDSDGITQVRFYRDNNTLAYATLLATVGDLKLHGTQYKLSAA